MTTDTWANAQYNENPGPSSGTNPVEILRLCLRNLIVAACLLSPGVSQAELVPGPGEWVVWKWDFCTSSPPELPNCDVDVEFPESSVNQMFLDFYNNSPSVIGESVYAKLKMALGDPVYNAHGTGQPASWHTNFRYHGPASGFVVQLTIEERITTVEPPWSTGDARNKNAGRPHRSACAGNPCDIASGNKYQRETDFEGTFGLPPIVRHYNSLLPDVSVGFGQGWTASFSRRLEFVDGDIRVRRASGRAFRFNYSAGAWHADPDIRFRLTQVAGGYEVLAPDDRVERYSSTGLLTSETDVNGLSVTYVYDASDRLETVVGFNGAALTFEYNTAGRIESISDDAGRTWEYQYGDDKLTYVYGPDGSSRQYHYENQQQYIFGEDLTFPYLLTGITDERGVRRSTFEYDTSGRATASYRAGDVGGIGITYGSGISRQVKNSRDYLTSYTIKTQNDVQLVTRTQGKGCASCVERDAAFDYDEQNNNLLSETVFGLETEYGDFDSNGNYGYMIERSGTTTERRTDYTYDPRFFSRTATATEPSVYSGGNRVTTYEYDDFGNPLSITVSGFAPDGTAVERVTAFKYEGPFNQLSEIDGPRTDAPDITTFTYYPNDPAEGANSARLRSVVGPEGIVERAEISYTTTGKIGSENLPNGIVRSYEYYPGNVRLKSITDTDSATGSSRTTQWTYLTSGEIDLITVGYGSPDATVVDLDYDDAGRLVRVADGLGNYVKYTLDTEGNLWHTKIFDDQDSLKRALDQLFDEYNRLKSTIQANETTDVLSFINDDVSTAQDGEGIQSHYQYDTARRLQIEYRDWLGLNVRTQYQYDVADRLISVQDGNYNSTTYQYDDLGNLLIRSSPDTGTTTFQEYDGAGNLIRKVDANQQVFVYAYDDRGRLLSTDVVGSIADDISYTYDNCTNGEGRLCEVVYGPESASPRVETYAYNAFGDVTLHQGTTYTYDTAGRVRTMLYPSGSLITYRYDAAGAVETIELDRFGETTILASGVVWEPFGPVRSLHYGNGLSLTHDHDSAYRTTSIQVPGALDLVYDTYDGNGNLKVRTVTDGTPIVEQYAYDQLQQLDTAAGTFGSRDYDYLPDRNGNRKMLTDGAVTTYEYEAETNRLESETGWLYGRDANGNTLSRLSDDGSGTGRVFGYNPHNRLVSVTDRSGLPPVDTVVGSYRYNGMGQRVRKDAGGMITEYRYGLDGLLLAELNDSGVATREYVYLDGAPFAVLDHPGEPLEPGLNLIWDNGDFGTSSTGTWYVKNNPVYQFGQDNLSGPSGSPKSYRWSPSLPPGMYEVYAWWLVRNQNTTNAPYEIYHDNTMDYVEKDHTINNGQWTILGPHYFSGDGSEYVEVTNANGKVSVDAMRFYRPPGIVIDNGAPGTSSTGTWNSKTAAKNYGPDDLSGPAGPLSTYRWTPQLAPGTYKVYAWWIRRNNMSTSVPYTIEHDGGSTTVYQNQQDKGAQWRLLGTFEFSGDGSEYVEISNVNGKTSADAVRFEQVVPSTDVYYVHNDHLATPKALTDGSGTVVWKAHHDPFGDAAVEQDPDGDGTEIVFNGRFPGQYFDAESGVHYNYFRTLDPATGRYLESDPIGLAGGLNTYGYVGGNPLNYVDPFGLDTMRCARKLGDPNNPAMKPKGNPLRHDYLVVNDEVFSFQAGDSMLWSDGRIDSNEKTSNEECELISEDPEFDEAVKKAVDEIGAPKYNVWAYRGTTTHLVGARNCQTWADDVLRRAERILESKKDD